MCPDLESRLEKNSLGQAELWPLPLLMVGPLGLATEARIGRTSEVGMRRIHADANRNAVCALDAAHLRSMVEGYESFGTTGQWLPGQLEPPM